MSSPSKEFFIQNDEVVYAVLKSAYVYL